MQYSDTSIIMGRNNRIIDAFLTTADNGTSMTIGNSCLFSANVIVRTSDSHSIIDSTTKQRINYGRNVSIGNMVWVGYGVTILKGSVIGDNTAIGTESLVSGSQIPPNSIAVGIPAKIVKSNVEWDYVRIQR